MSEKLTTTVPKSGSLERAVQDYLVDLGASVRRVIEANPDGWRSESHDGGTFMLPWAPYVEAEEGELAERALRFMRGYGDSASEHFQRTGQWHHGYWRRQEVHHGTEHFGLFLTELWRIGTEDDETVRQFEDAAEHIGNWAKGVPPWWDEDRGMFVSYYLGTEEVGEPTLNVPDHLRLTDMLLTAHRMTGRERYLELAARYGRRWAGPLAEGDALPVALDRNGPVEELGEQREEYASFVGAAPEDLGDTTARVENLLASGAPDVMLRLWQRTSDDLFRRAAERVVDAAAEALADPVAWQAQAAVRRYRAATGSDRYDGAVRRLPTGCFAVVEELALLPKVQREKKASSRIGMRHDKPEWLDDGGRPAPSPLLWYLWGEVADDSEMRRRAVDLAHAHFLLARRAYGDTTEHGCGSRSLSAVARGHGRRNGAGVVTEALSPALAAVR